MVSTLLASDEILIELLGPKRLIAVTQFAGDREVSNIAGRVATIPHRVVALHAEEILSWQPTAVVASEFNRPEPLAMIASENIPVFRFPDARSVQQIQSTIQAMGDFCLERKAAEALVTAMQQKTQQVVQRASTQKSRLRDLPHAHSFQSSRHVRRLDDRRTLLWFGGGYTAGNETLFDELLTMVGGQNAAKQAGLKGYASLAVESALALDPDMVIKTSTEVDSHTRALFTRSEQQSDPLWKHSRAGRNHQIKTVPARHLLSTSQHAIELAEDLRTLMYGP